MDTKRLDSQENHNICPKTSKTAFMNTVKKSRLIESTLPLISLFGGFRQASTKLFAHFLQNDLSNLILQSNRLTKRILPPGKKKKEQGGEKITRYGY
jgi:hypothetical protein